MGAIEARFGGLKFENEAEVSQNFVVPLLTEFLSYNLNEILPEHQVPAFEIPLNRGKSVAPQIRPDYIITTGENRYAFVVDSKKPNEDVENHLDQLRAYCIGLRLNFLVISNGIELKVFNANDLVFYARSIADLDLQFGELQKLLARERVLQLDNLQRLQQVNRTIALGEYFAQLNDERKKRVAISVSDFIAYLEHIGQMSSHVQLPPNIQAAFEIELNRFSPHELYRMVEMVPDLGFGEAKQHDYSKLLQGELVASTRVLVGESGIGKSNLLQHLVADLAKKCLAYTSDSIPVLLKLGGYTATRSLVDLILDELVSHGARTNVEGVRHLLIEGRLILLLDAFDEAFAAHIPDLEREIDNLRTTYATTSIVISTRHFRIPNVQISAKYELQTLTVDIIDRIAALNLASESGVFIAQLKAKRLYSVASNTLLLNLLILLYVRDHTLPGGRSSTLNSVVSHVRKYYESKKTRARGEPSWQILETFLSRIAYRIVSSGESYTLPVPVLNDVLRQSAEGLETARMLEGGTIIANILLWLESTGFLVRTESGIAFWHRSFTEYFAALQSAHNFDQNGELPAEYIRSTAWESVLPLVVSCVIDPSKYVAYILSENVFLAGRCLIEFSEVDELVASTAIEALFTKCASPTVAIRMHACNLLCRIFGPQADARLVELTESAYVNVKSRAIEEIARRRLPQAREVTYSNVDWDQRSEEERIGSSLINVIQALGELGDAEAQMKIIGIWLDKEHLWVDYAARTVLGNLAERNLISPDVRELLCEMVLQEGPKEHYWSNLFSLVDVMSKAITPELASRIAADIAESGTQTGARRFYHSILGACNDTAFLRRLIEYIRDKSISLDARIAFLRALEQNAENVPDDVFCEQLVSRSYELRAIALSALARTRPSLVRDYARRAFQVHLVRDNVKGYSYAPVQLAALQVMAANNDLEVLLSPEYTDKVVSNEIVEKLCDFVANGGPIALLGYLDHVVERFGSIEKLHVAWLYADLGKLEKCTDIVLDMWRTSNDTSIRTKIIEGAHRLPPDIAIALVQESLNEPQQRQGGSLLRATCFECMEAIGTSQAANLLAETVERIAGSTEHPLDQERALRALVSIAPRDKENWILNLIAEDKIEKRSIHRAIELLGLIGTSRSIPSLLGYLEGADTFIQFITFWAIDEIYTRSGEIWYYGEETITT